MCCRRRWYEAIQLLWYVLVLATWVVLCWIMLLHMQRVLEQGRSLSLSASRGSNSDGATKLRPLVNLERLIRALTVVFMCLAAFAIWRSVDLLQERDTPYWPRDREDPSGSFSVAFSVIGSAPSIFVLHYAWLRPRQNLPSTAQLREPASGDDGDGPREYCLTTNSRDATEATDTEM